LFHFALCFIVALWFPAGRGYYYASDQGTEQRREKRFSIDAKWHPKKTARERNSLAVLIQTQITKPKI
jgi:hypothetical protein